MPTPCHLPVHSQIRPAVARDAGDLTAVAHSAKRHWGYPAAWLAAWEAALTVQATDLERQVFFVAEAGGDIQGFYGAAPGTPRWRLEHLWVVPAHMGRGVGRLLLEHALAFAHAAGARGLEIESDPHAEPFYARLGAHRTGSVAAPAPGAPERRLPLLVLDRTST